MELQIALLFDEQFDERDECFQLLNAVVRSSLELHARVLARQSRLLRKPKPARPFVPEPVG